METKDYITIAISSFSLFIAVCALLKDWWRNRSRFFLNLSFNNHEDNVLITVRNMGNRTIYISDFGYKGYIKSKKKYGQLKRKNSIITPKGYQLPIKMDPKSSILLNFKQPITVNDHQRFIIKDTEDREYYKELKHAHRK